jgi:hypothetical protein
MLMMREDITPADVQGLRDEITMLMMRDDITPEDVQGLRDQITMLMMRDDITPEDVQALRDQITTLMMRPTQADLDAAEDRGDAFEKAQNARDDATGAVNTATEAVEDATEASGKITALTVAGDSAMAEVNAQAVLTARDDANDAVTTAEMALQSAKTALADVDADADSLIRALEAAITVAEDQLKLAKAQAEGTALKAAVALVEGEDPKADSYPMTPAQHGKAVAMDIAEALLPTSGTDGGRARGTHGDTPPADTVEDAVKDDDHQGMNWAEIVGAANVRDMRIASGTGTKLVKAASLAGMAATSASSGNTPEMTEDVVIVDGAQYNDAAYQGIPGEAFCAGTDCNVDADGNLVGSWYFTPEDGDEFYIGTTTAGVTTYTVETLYARFGHWLAASGENTAINTYAMTGAGTVEGSNYDLNTVNTGAEATTLTDTSAEYSGPAAGMSVYKTFNTDGTIDTIRSAAFTAMVNLKATFGTDATLAGTVNDFSGDAVGDWTVELLSRGFDGSFDDGRTVATGRDGVWSAQAYGSGPTERPTGIYGGFNAHFSDGHAAGAYATRKE